MHCDLMLGSLLKGGRCPSPICYFLSFCSSACLSASLFSSTACVPRGHSLSSSSRPPSTAHHQSCWYWRQLVAHLILSPLWSEPPFPFRKQRVSIWSLDHDCPKLIMTRPPTTFPILYPVGCPCDPALTNDTGAIPVSPDKQGKYWQCFLILPFHLHRHKGCLGQ